MFTTIYEKKIGDKRYVIGDVRSTDTKPTEDVLNGSVLHEIDTGKTFKFDQENKTWEEQ